MTNIVPHRHVYQNSSDIYNDSFRVDNPEVQFYNLYTSANSKEEELIPSENKCSLKYEYKKQNIEEREQKQNHRIQKNDKQNRHQNDDQYLIKLAVQNRQYLQTIQLLHNQLNQQNQMTEQLMHAMANSVKKLGHFQRQYHSLKQKNKKIEIQLIKCREKQTANKKQIQYSQQIPSITVFLGGISKPSNQMNLRQQYEKNYNKNQTGKPILQSEKESIKNQQNCSTLYQQLKALKLEDLLGYSHDKQQVCQANKIQNCNKINNKKEQKLRINQKKEAKNHKNNHFQYFHHANKAGNILQANSSQNYQIKQPKQMQNRDYQRKFSLKNNRQIQNTTKRQELLQEYSRPQNKIKMQQIFIKTNQNQLKTQIKNNLPAKIAVRSFK